MNSCKRLLAMVLVICITLTLFPTAAFAQEDTSPPCPHHEEHTPACGYTAETPCGFDPAACPVCNPKDSGAGLITITAFAQLADDIRWQRTLTPVLPETLTATADGAEVQAPVTWSAEGFDPAKPADGQRFTLLPTLSEGYALAEGVSLPQITLVTPPKKRLVGEGTKNNPLQITSAEQLEEIRDQVNAGVLEKLTFGVTTMPVYLKLMADIDLGGENWKPIGIDGNRFKSHFDGNGKKITGLKINSTAKYQGLFGYVEGGTVENLAVLDVDITGSSNRVGGVVGQLDGGTVKNCYTSGLLHINNATGGVVGQVENGGTVANCYSTARVGSSGDIGGVVGYIGSGTVKSCAGLNTYVWGDSAIGRVAGHGTGEDCYGFSGMSGGALGGSGAGPWTGFNGAPLTTDQIAEGTILNGLFTGGHWKTAPGKLPGFGEAVEMPAHLLSNTAPFPGAGTESDPYQISTAAQLRKLAQLVNAGTDSGNGKTYKLTADLDLLGYAGLDSGKGWEPIGTASKKFEGTFDGGGHKISGLKISRGSVDNIGLFGYMSAGGVRNLGLVGVNITGGTSVGGVAGHLIIDVIVENCYVTGSVTGGDGTGGVVGTAGGTVQSCYSTASVTTSSGIGVGGVVGTGSNVKNCAALGGSVSGSSNVGRVFGQIVGGGTPVNNYAFDSMTGGGSDKTASGLDGADLAPAKIADGVTLQNLLGSAWTTAPGKLPGLGGKAEELPAHLLGAAPFPGAGTEGDPYQISTPAQLAHLAALVNGGASQRGTFFRLQNNLDLSAYQTGTGWKPIGTSSNVFEGTFDGGGYKITGLYIKDDTTGDAGLFGQVSGGTIRNLGIEGANINGGAGTGGVVGQLNDYGTIERCYVTGRIKGKRSTGGVVGGVYSSNLNNCYATASVGGDSQVGGVVGFLSNDYGGGTINCYASGSVTGTGGTGATGGVVGYLASGTVKNCAALNLRVSGTGTNIGRVVGLKNSLNPTTTNNYAFSGMTCTSQGSYVVDGDPISTSDVLYPAFWQGSAGWDDSVWTFPTSGDKLPTLKGFKGAQPDDSGFYLTRRSIAAYTMAVTGGPFGYTGKEIAPEVKVTLDAKTLEKDKDYTVTGATEVGPATVTVAGMGEYIGTLEQSFTIAPKQLTWDATAPGTVNPKTVDGTTTATVATPPKLAGLVPGDDVTVTCTVEFDSSEVGESVPVKVISWSLTGAKAGNYSKPVGNPTFASGKITAVPTTPTTPRGSSTEAPTDNREYAFWMRVKSEVNAANPGDVIKVNAGSYDKMPTSVISALLENGVGLAISWAGGSDIVIPAGKAKNPEELRIYYPLSLLAELYQGIELVETPAGRQNPETGGPTYSYLDTATGQTSLVAGGVTELSPLAADAAPAATDTAAAITPPDAGFEPDTFAGTPDAQRAKGPGPGAAAAVLLLAGLAGGGVWYWRKRKSGAER